jgi:6,7-dimethyl-8-ribityllumazine synthase
VTEHRDDFGDWPYRDLASQLRPPGDARSEEEQPRRLPSREELGYPPEEPLPPRLPTREELGLPPLQQEPEPQPVPEPAPEPEAEPEPEPLLPAAEQIPEVVREEHPVAPQLPPTPPQPEEPAAPEHAAGELRIPDGYSVITGAPGGGRRGVGVVVSRFNGEITNRLLESALAHLDQAGVPRDAIAVMPVPGAFELPLAAMALARTRRYSCIVALGCVIRGETPHFDFVAGEAASGLQLAAIETGIPVAFGLLTCETRQQAEARVDKGAEAASTALEMADLFARLRASAASG